MQPLTTDGQVRFALIGKSGAGKSEVARILQSEYGCQIVKTGAICRQISQILFGNDEKTSTQILDDALTSIDGSIFLKAALRDVAPDTPIVIDALRFTSDVALARYAGCVTVRVEARDEDRLGRLELRGQQFNLSENGTHRSETELDEHSSDFRVVNDCTFDTLRNRVVQTLGGNRS